jgi:uncharacterized membrane protein
MSTPAKRQRQVRKEAYNARHQKTARTRKRLLRQEQVVELAFERVDRATDWVESVGNEKRRPRRPLLEK